MAPKILFDIPHFTSYMLPGILQRQKEQDVKKFFLVCTVLIISVVVGYWGLAKYKNRRITPDYYEVYKTQDTVPVGKVGVFTIGLIMPETLENPQFFYNIAHKIFKNIIPWPFRLFSYMDKGIALFDTEKYLEEKEFTPKKLIDMQGRDRFLDGEPYIEKYKRGEVVWVPPSKRIHKDIGYFLYTDAKGGLPNLVGKMIIKARLWYYDKGMKQKKVPHWAQTFSIIDRVFEKTGNKYDNVMFRAESSMYYYEMKTKIYEMLDAGCETLVLISPMMIYSHFEEFNSAFYHCFEYVHEWEQENPGKKIKVIMAPQPGDFQPARQAFLDMLKDRLDTLPEGSDVFVAVTVHGMPWAQFPWEAWLELAPAYRDKLHAEVKELLKKYTFGRTKTVECQDEFASHVWDHDDNYLSTREAYQIAIDEKFDYAIGLPIEFIAENTDTLFYHALKNYEDFDDYDIYEQFDYPNWNVPFTMEFKQKDTQVIYNGVPVGKYSDHMVEAFCMSLDTILSQRK